MTVLELTNQLQELVNEGRGNENVYFYDDNGNVFSVDFFDIIENEIHLSESM